MTEIPTLEGKVYLADVEELFSRSVIGFAICEHADAELAKAAIQTAVTMRGGTVAGVIFHSDRGSTYTADLFTEACDHHKIRQSMGRTGSCLGNAAAEPFFSTLEHELLSRTTFRTKRKARRRVAALDRQLQPPPPPQRLRHEVPHRLRSGRYRDRPSCRTGPSTISGEAQGCLVGLRSATVHKVWCLVRRCLLTQSVLFRERSVGVSRRLRKST